MSIFKFAFSGAMAGSLISFGSAPFELVKVCFSDIFFSPFSPTVYATIVGSTAARILDRFRKGNTPRQTPFYLSGCSGDLQGWWHPWFIYRVPVALWYVKFGCSFLWLAHGLATQCGIPLGQLSISWNTTECGI